MSKPFFINRTIALIGYGRFAQLLTQLLLEHTQAVVWVVSSRAHTSDNERLQFKSMHEIEDADVIIPCVPISAFEETVVKIAEHVSPGTLVIDICSVKVFPTEVMQKLLPPSVEILGSHPLWGPDSVRKNTGLKNLPVVLCPIRISPDHLKKIGQFLTALKLNVLEMTPEQHDQYAAYSQAYAFLIGKIGEKMQLQPTPIDTFWYTLLQEEIQAVKNDSHQLFVDIQTKNPFAAEMRRKFMHAVEELQKELHE
jgi:prephenate dehydrogenase